MKRIFIDREKCDGCKNCSVACMQSHRAEPGTVYDLDLRDRRNTARHQIFSDGKGAYIPVFCRHCTTPDCVNACMSGALRKDTESGLVLYDRSRCGRCFMCVMNCPYGNVKPEAPSQTEHGCDIMGIVKCDFCSDSPEAALGPACVRSCPKKALHVEEVFYREVAL